MKTTLPPPIPPPPPLCLLRLKSTTTKKLQRREHKTFNAQSSSLIIHLLVIIVVLPGFLHVYSSFLVPFDMLYVQYMVHIYLQNSEPRIIALFHGSSSLGSTKQREQRRRLLNDLNTKSPKSIYHVKQSTVKQKNVSNNPSTIFFSR